MKTANYTYHGFRISQTAVGALCMQLGTPLREYVDDVKRDIDNLLAQGNNAWDIVPERQVASVAWWDLL